ncbi:MAG: LON peptidase substrate-binding domain-containing protein [Deltaproteobacteria bacterium]|nr:LON peptidase substrate-binding domain-containing protein [Deltaproteobacteria bacterium]MBW2681501.1 LON peptidase substrate-binding domain-containing protein [Deltaproteobacteria bacterium]
MTGHHIIPLFPLGVVLLPQMELSLHVFEERYKVMINECLEQEREFGVVHYDGTDIRSIGCTAKIMRGNGDVNPLISKKGKSYEN